MRSEKKTEIDSNATNLDFKCQLTAVLCDRCELFALEKKIEKNRFIIKDVA